MTVWSMRFQHQQPVVQAAAAEEAVAVVWAAVETAEAWWDSSEWGLAEVHS